MNISSSTSSSTDYSRITGLATGMDTDAMVKQMIAGEQAKLDKINQDKQVLEWQQEAYVDIIKDLKGFYNDFLDILGPSDTNMMSSSTYAGVKSVTDSGNVTATAFGGAITGEYKIEVTTIAAGAKVPGSSANQLVSGDINLSLESWEGKTITFETSDGIEKEITITGLAEGFTLNDLTNKIKAQTDNYPELNINVVAEGDKIKFTSTSDNKMKIVKTETSPADLDNLDGKYINDTTKESKLSDLGIVDGDFKIKINDKEFTITVDSSKTINQFMNDIKDTKLDNGETLNQYININFSDLTKKMTIETKSTGKAQTLLITSGTSNAEEMFGIVTAEAKTGTDAVVKITPPGEELGTTVTRSSNKFTIDNMTYDLSSAKSGETTIINIVVDSTLQVDKFKKFVEKYNELIEKINDKITEKKNYNYKPLTDTQKEAMKEEEIKNWEEQAKKGLLSRDNNLSNLLSQVRQTLYSTVEGTGLSLSEIGITTTSNYKDGGKLQIDEAKLKDALEIKGDLVQKLFTQNSSTANEKGILQRIKNTFGTYIGSEGTLIKKAGYTNTRWVANNQLSKSIEDKNKAIKEMQNKMYAKQERYYKMFAALERNMNNLNSQSNWLYSQLGTA